MENMNNFQGKRPDQYSNSAKFAWYGVVGMVLLLIILTLLGGCGSTQPTKKCCEKEDNVESSILNKVNDSIRKLDENYCYPYDVYPPPLDTIKK